MINLNLKIKTLLNPNAFRSTQLNFLKIKYNSFSDAELLNFSNKSFKSSASCKNFLYIIKNFIMRKLK